MPGLELPRAHLAYLYDLGSRLIDSRRPGTDNEAVARSMLASFFDVCLRIGQDQLLAELDPSQPPSDRSELADHPRYLPALVAQLDTIDLDTLYARQGASKRARDYLAGQHVNALYGVWRFAVMRDRGIPLSEGETYHLKGGNGEMPKAFAARLGARVKLSHPITAIQHDATGVTVTYTAYGYDAPQTMRADYLVNAISDLVRTHTTRTGTTIQAYLRFQPAAGPAG